MSRSVQESSEMVNIHDVTIVTTDAMDVMETTGQGGLEGGHSQHLDK